MSKFTIFLKSLFSFKGRLSRKDFIIQITTLFFCSILLHIPLDISFQKQFLLDISPYILVGYKILIVFGFIYLYSASIIKRYHDINFPWYPIIPIIIYILLLNFLNISGLLLGENAITITSAFGFCVVFFLLPALLKKGSKGININGPIIK